MKLAKPFADRRAAGRALAKALTARNLAAPVILALPRGGVPVAAEIASALKAPLDIVLVRKIGVPFQRELAVAAVVDGAQPEVVVNEDVSQLAGVTPDYIDAGVMQELQEIERRRQVYLQGRVRVPLEGRTVVLVDDGIATGATVRAAVRALKRKALNALILAVPVAPLETIEALKSEVDEIFCLRTPEPFVAIGVHYADFHQVSDDEVVRLLAEQTDQRAQPHRAK
ncbi:MAG: phosphoribosyltransferase [Hyphomicrobiaceae bacterium]|nr:MAG: phosphoribosyltransferase [Hyphomicrobiaceae bacterium]